MGAVLVLLGAAAAVTLAYLLVALLRPEAF